MVATLELFHLYAEEAGWTLDATLPSGERVVLEGRVRTPALPGPSDLVVWYVDAPRVVTRDNVHGTLSVGDERPHLACVALGAGLAHIRGTLTLTWVPIIGGASKSHAIAIEIEIDAQLIT